ncbi:MULTISPECIES: hypothetical protein [Vibrio]|uniref:hypothetical protein n=1 Tax=Vibrio TaxID=662 RepID=UPI0020764CF6|nr:MULTISPECIES: hypothetical protein [Vibrio]USD35511.1 hypothetical protein J8Z27_23105 [Vibrio sp. SCSIO 43186]USD72635.1 hypothetical protein J4N41_23110 [Vibrio sp. SCSIO 43139]USD99026.1 hypothetical protein CTT30_23420 [Vibrio coralliilyticus]
MKSSHDSAHVAIISLNNYIRLELVIWFIIAWLSIGLAGYTVYLYNSATSEDVNREFIPVNRSGGYLEPIARDKPSHLNDQEVENWVTEKLSYCLTFDWQSYGYISSNCNSEIFSTNYVPYSFVTRGQDFQKQLKDSNIIPTLMSNKTSMTIKIEEARLVQAEVREYDATYLSSDGSRQWIPYKDKRYIYEFEYTFRIEMSGQKLDAPIRYQVLVERTSELFRWHGLAIRSVLSLD